MPKWECNYCDGGSCIYQYSNDDEDAGPPRFCPWHKMDANWKQSTDQPTDSDKRVGQFTDAGKKVEPWEVVPLWLTDVHGGKINVAPYYAAIKQLRRRVEALERRRG